MIPFGAQSEEGLHNHLHCLGDQCLQLWCGQQLDLLELQEPLEKQAHELPLGVLDFQTQDEPLRLARPQGALWEQPDLSSWFCISWREEHHQ